MLTRKRQAAQLSEKYRLRATSPGQSLHRAFRKTKRIRLGDPRRNRGKGNGRKVAGLHVDETATTLDHFRRLVREAELGDREHIGVERKPFLLAVQSEPPVVTAALFVAKQALHRGSFPYIAFSLGGAHFHASTVENDCRKSIQWCL